MQKYAKSSDGTKICYDVSYKSKKFIVFVHGAGGDFTAWRKERAFFHKQGYSTIALDLRGHGISGRPKKVENYQLKHFVDDIFCVIIKEKIDDIILIGHCFGGMVCELFAQHHTGVVQKYILIDTTYKAPKTLHRFVEKHHFLLHVFNVLLEKEDLKNKHFTHVKYHKYIGTGDFNLKRIYSDITHTSLKSWIFTYENLANFNGIKALKQIKKPVLIIQGERDHIFNVATAKTIKKLTKNSILKTIPKANHILVINNPEDLNNTILEFCTMNHKT